MAESEECVSGGEDTEIDVLPVVEISEDEGVSSLTAAAGGARSCLGSCKTFLQMSQKEGDGNVPENVPLKCDIIK